MLYPFYGVDDKKITSNDDDDALTLALSSSNENVRSALEKGTAPSSEKKRQ
jgi:hypothetical protein